MRVTSLAKVISRVDGAIRSSPVRCCFDTFSLGVSQEESRFKKQHFRGS